MTTVDHHDLKICRMSVSECDGALSKIRFYYLIAKREGIERFEEDHELALYTVEEMKFCFQEAGMIANYDPQGIFDRGIYVAREGRGA